jgi:hypothetical protein
VVSFINPEDGYKNEIYNNSSFKNIIVAFNNQNEIGYKKGQDYNKFLLSKYKSQAQVYIHTFKQNDIGNYYWYSTKPEDN